MVIPLGPANVDGLLQAEVEVPSVIKEKHVIFWYILMLLWICTVVGQFIALDLLGACTSGIMAYIVWCMIRDDCAMMTQSCLMAFGFMTGLCTFFELLALMTLMGGRTLERIGHFQSTSPSSSSFTVTLEKHPFFDSSQGLVYNMQSAMLIASPVCNFIAAVLSYFAYNAYPTFLFQDDGEIRPMGPGLGGYGGARVERVERFQGGGQRRGGPTGFRMFEGTGQRLGN
mmetsp:Transcript_37627/g.103352  ORF Transcript_37627/g.103352 Transcript_37627/m.103352 type:complete len:228 (-) Transcript_37627:35-718(-)